jgi:heparinase II/III-like protein
VLGRPEWAWLAGDGACCLPWLVGKAGLEAFDAMDTRPPHETARLFADGGYFVARDRWTPGADFVVVDCGPHGVQSCGHAHADALSIEYTLAGVPILIDPGTYSYAQPERDEFRATVAHNTITVDDRSSSEPGQPFRWKTAANCKILRATADDRVAFFEGEHDGFMRLADPARHRRAVFAVFGEFLVITDTIETRGTHDIAGRLHFGQGLSVVPNPGRAGLGVFVTAPDTSASKVADVFVLGDDVTLGVQLGRVAPVYGATVQAPVGTFTSRGSGTRSIWTILISRRVGRAESHVSLAGDASSRALVIRTGELEDIITPGMPAVSFGDMASDATWLWIRRRPRESRLDEFALIDGSQLTVRRTSIVSVPSRRERIRGRSHESGWAFYVSPA